MPALTQQDVDKLKRAIASGIRTVQYASGTVTYQSIDDMLKALAFAENELDPHRRPPSSLAVFSRN
jgi:hypothetical protein